MANKVCMDCQAIYGISQTDGDSHGLCPICMNRRMADVAKYRKNNLTGWRNDRRPEASESPALYGGSQKRGHSVNEGLIPSPVTNLSAWQNDSLGVSNMFPKLLTSSVGYGQRSAGSNPAALIISAGHTNGASRGARPASEKTNSPCFRAPRFNLPVPVLAKSVSTIAAQRDSGVEARESTTKRHALGGHDPLQRTLAAGNSFNH